MTMVEQETATNCDDLATMLKELTPAQLTWVSARIHADSDVQACETSGIGQSTIRRWRLDGVAVNEVVRLIRQDSVLLGREKLRRLITKAVDVLDREMDGKRKMEAACEVLDRVGIVALQKMEVKTDGVVELHVVYDHPV